MNDLIHRYDCCSADFERLDIDSTMALVELQQLWTARARLRGRWIIRRALFGTGALS